MLTLLTCLSLARASDVIGEETHAELVAGFMAGDRSLGMAPLVQVDSGRPLAGLDDAFAGYPLHDAVTFGPHIEGRIVAPPLRVSAGWQRPYPDWESPVVDARERDGADVPVVSSVRALTVDEIVLAIGAEAPTGLVVPFADLVGIVHRTRVTLEVDGVKEDYRSESFSLGGRAGLRIQMSDHTFVELAGEGAPLGPRTWGASVGLGVAAF